MRVIKKDSLGKGLLELLLTLEGWDRTFEFEGHTYCVIQKGNSLHTKLKHTAGMIPVFNIKSRTIRAVHEDTPITPLNGTANTEEWRP